MPVTTNEGGGAQTLERGLALLVELSRHPQGLTTTQAAAAMHLHRSITHRLLVSLHSYGFAARDDDGRYTVGPAVSEIGERARPALRDIAQPILNRLAIQVDATASLIEVIGGFATTTVVAQPPTDGPLFSYRLGSRDPVDRGSGGLAALASGPHRVGEPERVTLAREQGYITTYAELNPGAYGIAAPLPGWGMLAAVNIVTARKEVLETAVAPLAAAVQEIGRPS